ncbi:MAG: FAD-dependent oxidoreductase [Firmicutes bacterium]|nr:FAD-dependent oxidoreductase [Dethiobacter sp.]MBS3889742.1 FAD-dependent oxidoreductase [Bacillota bacterium]MBS4053403.1 FAD-dependent oxidoreductase [Thermaerobacter sp.]
MRIAVIGGGFSGLLAAYLLEQKGIKTTVFEREDNLGGHCQTLVSKNFRVELGTAFFLNDHIKELLAELDVSYTARHSYRDFVDKSYARVPLLPEHEIALLMSELARLEVLLTKYGGFDGETTYGYVHEDLNVPLSEFLSGHDFKAVHRVIAPHLSAYGFGSIDEVQAYYALNAFDLRTINQFMRGEKLLFINEGTADIIAKLSCHITDIRYTEVSGIAPQGGRVQVSTAYGIDTFDKVLISTVVSPTAIQDEPARAFMQRLSTNDYVSCAFEIANKNRVTTYYLDNLGQQNALQFFHAYKQKERTIAVAYAYGLLDQHFITAIHHELQASGIVVKHLIAARQWRIFPHLKKEALHGATYTDITQQKESRPIYFIGSLITKPSISHLYLSVKGFVEQTF